MMYHLALLLLCLGKLGDDACVEHLYRQCVSCCHAVASVVNIGVVKSLLAEFVLVLIGYIRKDSRCIGNRDISVEVCVTVEYVR